MLLRVPPGHSRAPAGPGRVWATPRPGTHRPCDRRAIPARSALAAAVQRAYAEFDNGNHQKAASVVEAQLATRDPRTAADDDDLIYAALLWHQVRNTDQIDTHAWDRYAHQASRRLHGPDGDLTLAAATSLATILTLRTDREGLDLHRHVLDVHTRHGNTDPAIIARLALAGALHTFGACADATAHAARAWSDWRNAHHRRDSGAILIAVPLIAILIACDRVGEALRVLGQLAPALPPPGTPQRADITASLHTIITSASERHGNCTYSLEPLAGSRALPRERIDWRDYLQ